MRVIYVGPEPAVVVFGTTFPQGVAVDVEDEHAASKLSAHPQFTVSMAGVVAEDYATDAPKRRGRPPKAQS